MCESCGNMSRSGCSCPAQLHSEQFCSPDSAFPLYNLFVCEYCKSIADTRRDELLNENTAQGMCMLLNDHKIDLK